MLQKDESFSPGFDPYADISTLSDMSQLSAATPGRGSSMPLLNDSSLYSPNTCSKQNHRKAICASSDESLIHSTPVRSDFCPDMDTPSTDILCQVEQSRKNGGRKRTMKSGEKQVESEPKKSKKSGSRKGTSARRSGKKKQKTNGVSELRRGASGDDCEEELVTKRLNFDADFSAAADILQPSLHPPPPVSRAEVSHSPPVNSRKPSSSKTSMSLVSDTSVEHYDGNSCAMLCATSDGEGLAPETDQTGASLPADSSPDASSRSQDGCVVKNKTQSNGKSKDSSAMAKSTPTSKKEVKGKSKRNGRLSPPRSTTSEDSGPTIPPGSSCEGHVTKGEPTSAMEISSGTFREEEKSYLHSESDSDASPRSECSESESSESGSEDDLPAINMEVDESVSGELLGMVITISSGWRYGLCPDWYC